MNKTGNNGQKKRLRTLRTRGDVKMPRMTKEQLQKRIDIVVAKAQQQGSADLGADVVRDVKFSHFGIRRVRVHRLG